jgi:hypothetical protein
LHQEQREIVESKGLDIGGKQMREDKKKKKRTKKRKKQKE